MMPKWVIEAAKEIDLLYGENDISKKVAEIIWDKYKNAQQADDDKSETDSE